SKSMRKFDRPGQMISFGKPFPYKYDRRHDASIVVTHKFSDRFDMGLTWVYGTGNATTLDFEQYPSLDQLLNGYYNDTPEIPYYETRNNYRMPDYHRLDVSLNFHKEKKYGRRTWNISVYNVYNRKNSFYLSKGYDEHGVEKLYSWSLFPIIPSISWRLEF
ncbi:MAG TPA: TonB-dependent receptor, partial [Salinivirgaceae bacterium]|nr:TonB-dependent receptor [Salinivirgaceae bacterium]